jgi:hypothetical protein
MQERNNNIDKSHTDENKEFLKERDRKYKQAQREREVFSRAIENKYNQAETFKKTLVGLTANTLEGLNQITSHFEMSSRSRSLWINSMVSARTKQINEIIKLQEQASLDRSENYKSQVRGIAMEIAIKGGTRKEFGQAINQFNELIKNIAESNSNKTAKSDDIDIYELEVFKSLSARSK